MWIPVLRRTRRQVPVAQGYFNCPVCASRQPCFLVMVEARNYLAGFIPLPGQPVAGPESYHCLTCKRDWPADPIADYDYGEEAGTPPWQCFKCGREVAYESFECPHCGYRLEVGGRP